MDLWVLFIFASSKEVFLPKLKIRNRKTLLGSFLDFCDGSMVKTVWFVLQGVVRSLVRELKSHMLHSRKIF